MKTKYFYLTMLTLLCLFNLTAQIQVWNADDLHNIRNNLSGDYIQMADIDLNVSPYNEGEGWEPIGWFKNDYENDPFTGSYDGNGFSIHNLYINRSDYDYTDDYLVPQGLFGATSFATLTNITLINVDINVGLHGPGYGERGVGSLVGFCRTTHISNCSATGSLQALGQSFANYHIGGLIGDNRGGSISSCYTVMTVSGNADVGGLIGLATLTPISNSHASGTVYGNTKVGGLIGNYDQNYNMTGCYSEGTVQGDSDVGGLVGVNRASTIYNSYSRANVLGTGYDIGGFAGRSFVAAAIENCYSTGSVSGESDVGGFLGWMMNTNLANNYWDIETSGTSASAGGEGRTTAEMTHPYATNTYIDWDFGDVWADDIDYSVNDGYPYLQATQVSVEQENLIYTPNIKLNVYPNPFNPVANITISLSPKEMNRPLNLSVFNVKGELVRELIRDDIIGQPELILYWNGINEQNRSVASGIYFLVLDSGSEVQTKKILLLK